jgi:hypothetical protein
MKKSCFQQSHSFSFQKILQLAFLFCATVFFAQQKASAQDLTYGTADIVTYANAAAASVLKTGNGVTISQIGTQGTASTHIELNNSNGTPVLNSTSNDAITISTTRNIVKVVLTYSANGAANTANPYVGYNATETAMGSASVTISSCTMDATGVTGVAMVAKEYTAPANTNFVILTRGKACSPMASNTATIRISKIEVYLVPGPTITTTGSLFSFVQNAGSPSATQTYSVSGANLTNDIVVTPPVNFEVSNNAGANWYTNASPLTLTQSGGTVSSTTITVRLNASSAGVYSGNIANTSVNATTKNVAVSGNTSIVFYSKNTGDLSVLGTWGTNADGTGTAPSSFTDNYQAFNIVNNATPTIASNWTVSGLGSRIIVGDGILAVNFTIPVSNSLTGVIDAVNNATITQRNTTNPTFGTLSTGSNVVFDGSASLTIPIGNYYNLSSTNDGGATRTLDAVTVGFAGTFTPGSATYITTGSTVSFNGPSSQSIPSFSFNNLSVDNASATLAGTVTVSGATNINQSFSFGGTLVIGAGGTVTVAITKTLTVNGILENQSVGSFTLNGSMVISNGATYKINAAHPNSYSIPTATYSAGSTILVMQGVPRLNQSVIGGNVIWSSSNTGALLNTTPVTINGDLTITAGTLNNGGSGAGKILTVGGNLNIQGGEYTLAGNFNTTACTLNVNGTLTVSGGALYASSNPSSFGPFGIINVAGNVNHTGGSFGTVINCTAAISFNAAAAQSFATIGLSNPGFISYTIGSTSTPVVTFNADVSVGTGSSFLINAGSLIIAPGKGLTIAGTANFNNNNVTLQSNATGTGYLGQITGTLSNASNVTVQRFIVGGPSNGTPGRRAFRFLSHPFSGYVDLRQLTNKIDISGSGATASPTAANFTQTGSNAASAFWFNPLLADNSANDAGWQAFTNTLPANGSDANAWKSSQGIRVMVRGAKGEGLVGGSYTGSDVTLSMTGSVNIGTSPIAVTLEANAVPGAGWNLVGNPLPASVEIKAKIKAIREADGVHQNYLGATAYVWNANKAGSSRGGYDAIDLTAAGNYYLPMNGVVLLQSAINNNTSVSFSESDKSTDAGVQLFRNNGSTSNSIALLLNDANGVQLDETFIRFNDKAKNGFETNDGGKMMNEYALYSLTTDNISTYINSQPVPVVDAGIPLGVYSGTAKEFVIKAAEIDLPVGVLVYLKDNFLNKQIAITSNSFAYAFSTTADPGSKGNGRFELVFKIAPPLPVLNNGFTFKLSPNPVADVLKVSFSNEEKLHTTVTIINAEGKVVKTVDAGSLQTGTVSIDVKKLAKGSYYVTLNNSKIKLTEKLQIQ